MAEVIEPGRSRIEDILLGEEDIEPGRSRIEDILLSLYQDLVHLNDQGLIPTEYIPPQVFERMVTVANDTERFALTTDDVQNGDWVYVNSTQIMYFVSDEDHLDTEAGYTPVAAGIAAKAVADKNGNQIDTTYQTIIDSDHKLSADNVDDTNATNKFATAAQLDQINTNKNNISSNWGVAKNLLVNRGSLSNDNITYTWVNGDVSVTGIKVSESGTSVDVIPMTPLSDLGLSDKVVISNNGTNCFLAIILYDPRGPLQIHEIVSDSDIIDIPSGYTHIRALLGVKEGVVGSINETIQPMICTKAQWDISHEYQPYPFSNAELTSILGDVNTVLEGVL